MGSRYVKSKWKKTNILLKNVNLQEYIPVTLRLTKRNLKDLLGKYKMVYIKPNVGSGGIGVMKLKRIQEKGGSNQTVYQYQSGTCIRKFTSYDEFYNGIRKRTGHRAYLVQQGIHTLKYHGRPFDIRIMVQINPQKTWEVTGHVVRVAPRGKVVTNQHRGGNVYPLKKVLVRYFPNHQRDAFIERLNHLGLDVAKHLHKTFSGLKELGIDVALDQHKKPWVLEVNTLPGIVVFRKLKDKRMYRKMVSYGREYGRRY